MKDKKTWLVSVFLTVLATYLTTSANAQTSKSVELLSAASVGQSEIRWQPRVEYAGLILTVSTPDGDVIRREFASGVAPSFSITDKEGHPLPDGLYVFEIRLSPSVSPGVRENLAAARERGDDIEVERGFRKSGLLPAEESVQTGSFVVDQGRIIMGGAEEPRANVMGSEPTTPIPAPPKKKNKSGEGTITPQDQVIADDLIVQGSACVGLDCVNNENFGFDTIRLKENNTRIKFEDTSTSAGFPTTDWQLTANDSASGGASKFSIEDITDGRVPFTIIANAPTNSMFVDSSGRWGRNTSTPVLDIHDVSGNTPAMRLEQNGSSGFTAQTWDIAGNEANFFVRDVTGGSRLPFRIRPGAPTSSIDIAASGNVGIGAQSPSEKMHMLSSGATDNVLLRMENGTRIWTVGVNGASDIWRITDNTAGAARFAISNTGNIGLGGVTAPTSPIQHSNGATLTAGGAWMNGSSRGLKMNIHSLNTQAAFSALRQLEPVTFQYKVSPDEKHVGFIAEDVPDLVAATDRKTLSSMDIVAVLTKVVQEQQHMLVTLKQKVAKLERMKAKPARAVKTKKNLSKTAIK